MMYINYGALAPVAFKSAKLMKLSLGFSPCPNDTFIFHAMIHDKVDTEGLTFEVHYADVEELNKGAFNQHLDITKLSYHAFAYAMEHYALLHSGSALGNNCGPLLIAKTHLTPEDINKAHIAIPGQYTTANLLLGLAFPDAKHKTSLLFSDIEDAVLKREVDAGLIIHENRFTYQDKGLVKLMDLGEYWESNFHAPIPLGGIVIKRNLPKSIQQKVNRVLQRSVKHAWDYPDHSQSYVAEHAQEMDPKVMQQHIDLYVNRFSEDLGTEGIAAIEQLFQTARSRGVFETPDLPLFI
jgi:1,4-dihydroxy-6-naphthoate synthase